MLLDELDEAAIGLALEEISAGKYVTGEQLRAFLRRTSPHADSKRDRESRRKR